MPTEHQSFLLLDNVTRPSVMKLELRFIVPPKDMQKIQKDLNMKGNKKSSFPIEA